MLITNRLEYATFWQRLTAFMLDMLIVVVPAFLLTLNFAGPFFLDIDALKSAPNKDFEIIFQFYKYGVFLILACFAAAAFAMAIFTASKWQATPGKKIVGIYIVKRNGDKPTLANAFARFYSLPLFLLMIQVFERRETYAKLDSLKTSGKVITDLFELQTYLNSPAAEFTSLAVFMVILLWFLPVFFSRNKAAMHDILFETRVIKGKK